MAKQRSKRLALLQRLAGQYEQLAAQALGQAVGNVQMQKGRLEELKQFRLEYTQQFTEMARQGIEGETLHSYQNFLQQLDTAIAQQEQTILAAESIKQQKKNEWESKHTTTRVYDKTVARYQKQEQTQQQRREQNESDDRGQRNKTSD